MVCVGVGVVSDWMGDGLVMGWVGCGGWSGGRWGGVTGWWMMVWVGGEMVDDGRCRGWWVMDGVVGWAIGWRGG